MHYAPPALLAATLAAGLAPAQAQAPTDALGQPPFSRRAVAGLVTEPQRVRLADVVVVAAGPADVHPAGANAANEAADTRAAAGRPEVHRPVVVAQAAPAERPARAAPTRAARSSDAVDGTSSKGPVRPCSQVIVDPPTTLMLGKSQVVRLPFPVARLIVGGTSGSRAGRPEGAMSAPAGTPGAAAASQPRPNPPAQGAQTGGGSDGVAETDVTLLSPTELFFLGRRTGSMNVVLQANDGRCLVKDLVVTIDPGTLQAKLSELMPEEAAVKVRGADNAIVLTGAVSDAIKLEHILSLAGSYGDGKKVVNLLRVTAPQQVMLEVKIAEVSKTLLSRFGLDFSRMVRSGDQSVSMFSGIIGGAPGLAARFGGDLAATAIGGAGTAGTSNSAGSASGTAGGISIDDRGRLTFSPNTISKSSNVLGVDAAKNDGIVRVLAEPNIMAISGQPASFLSGGRIFIPVSQTTGIGGAPVITLEEKNFGVSLRFTPTVLDGRINLKIISEVSELSQTGSPFTTVGGATAILPSLTTRQVDTTVQLADGQSFAVAGLIKNNMTEALNKFPGLGEAPVVGALFRSTEFQTDQTELMFTVTPHLVKPLTAPVALPTDNHVAPNYSDATWMGKGEGSAPPPAPAPVAPQPVPAAAPAPTRP